MFASFVSGAVSGTTAVHGTPASLAAHASPCAMFPALTVQTPSASCSGEHWRTAFAAPRSLNDPTGCRFSSLRYTSAGASALSRTSGVLSAAPRMRRSAARMSSSGT